MRILVDVSKEQVAELNALARRTGKARAQVIREALEKHTATNRPSILSYKGLWADNPETQDVQGYLDRIRSEWDREWDT